MKKTILLGLITIFLFFSCKNETFWTTTEKYPTGGKKIEQEYYLDGEDSIFIYQKIYSPKGDLYIEGIIENGQRQGKWKSYFSDGQLMSKTEFKDGFMDGETKTYYQNGKLRYSGFYNLDEKDGEWNMYDSTGVFVKKSDFSK